MTPLQWVYLILLVVLNVISLVTLFVKTLDYRQNKLNFLVMHQINDDTRRQLGRLECENVKAAEVAQEVKKVAAKIEEVVAPIAPKQEGPSDEKPPPGPC